MANIFVCCLNCNSTNLRIRNSRRITQQTVESDCLCLNCSSKQKVLSEVVCLKTPIYTEQPEALKANKPFKEVNPDQLEIPTD